MTVKQQWLPIESWSVLGGKLVLVTSKLLPRRYRAFYVKPSQEGEEVIYVGEDLTEAYRSVVNRLASKLSF